MPRYYFHIIGDPVISDTIGIELPTLNEARQEALAFSSEVIGKLGERFWENESWRMEVTDAEGTFQFGLSFAPLKQPG